MLLLNLLFDSSQPTWKKKRLFVSYDLPMPMLSPSWMDCWFDWLGSVKAGDFTFPFLVPG